MIPLLALSPVGGAQGKGPEIAPTSARRGFSGHIEPILSDGQFVYGGDLFPLSCLLEVRELLEDFPYFRLSGGSLEDRKVRIGLGPAAI